MTDELTKEFLQHYAANREFQFEDLDKLTALAESQIADSEKIIAEANQARERSAAFLRQRVIGLRNVEQQRKAEARALESQIAGSTEPELDWYIRLAQLEAVGEIITRDMVNFDRPFDSRSFDTQIRTITSQKVEIEKRLKRLRSEKTLREMESAGPLQKALNLLKGSKVY